jgi:hypothetical protein
VSQDGLSKSPPQHQRRATVRYRCAPATIGKVLAADDQEIQRACILDVSLAGVGMLLPRPLACGQLVVISIRTSAGAVYELAAEVKHCSEAPNGDWLIGCQLQTRIAPEQLEELL